MDMSTPPVTEVNIDTRNLKKYQGAAARILVLLISGAKEEEAAKAVGVTPGYVSQLMGEEDFRIQVLSGLRDISEKAIEIDNDLLEIEHTLTNRLKAHAGFTTTANETLRLLKYVNEAKRHTQQGQHGVGAPGTSGHGSTGVGAAPVTIILPQFIQQQFIVNPNSEIIGIGERNLATIDSKALNKMVQTKVLEAPPTKVLKEIRRETRRSPADWSTDEL